MSAGTPQETLLGTREFLREYVARLKLNGWPVHAQEIEKVLAELDRLEQRLARLEGWTPERLARLFHETYERKAPLFGYQTRPESAVPWEDVPNSNKRLMRAVASDVLEALAAAEPEEKS